MSSRPATAPSPVPATAVRLLEGPPGRLRLHLTGRETPAVIALHGVGATGRQFRHLAVALAGHGLSTAAVDRPGAGGSTATDAGLGAQAAAALRAAEALAPGRALVWVGHSWGAAVALEAALTAPAAVGALVLVAPALVPFPLPLPFRLAVSSPGGWAVRGFLRLAGRPVVRWAMRGVYGPRAALVDDAAVAEELEGWRGQAFAGVAATARVMEAELRALGLRAGRLDRRIPVQLLLGERDPLTASGAPRAALVALLPAATLEVLPRCGHVLHVTEADAVAARIAAVAARVAAV